MDQLIACTAQQLGVQRELRTNILQLSQLREEFLQGKETPSRAKKMIRLAQYIVEKIESHHLEQLFSKEYLEELAFFASIAQKDGLRK